VILHELLNTEHATQRSTMPVVINDVYKSFFYSVYD